MKFLKIALLLILISCTATIETAEKEVIMTTENEETTDTGNQKAYFAGGCFWCMEPPFEALEGVLGATSGYMGGTMENPTYEDVVTGETGHAEVVEILYDPNIVTYEELLEVFWRNIDPTALNYQFADVGSQYRTEIFTVGKIKCKLLKPLKKNLVIQENLINLSLLQSLLHLNFILLRNIIKISIKSKLCDMKCMQRLVGEKDILKILGVTTNHE